MTKTMKINGKVISFENEKNMLEVIRNAGIELPTFCYYSELSIYGACRMCLVEDKRGNIVAACSEPPKDGAEIKTHTMRLQKQRKNTMELLLSSHDRDCLTCTKSGNCKLQDLSTQLGVDRVRFGKTDDKLPLDTTSSSIVRDPNKCILCGDCVRVCEEIQGIGVIGFTHRGAKAQVAPPFGKNLSEVDCIDCGMCVAHCPTAALEVKSEANAVFMALNNPKMLTMAQVAPAVKVSFGEAFGLKPGEITTGKVVGALKALGFDMVFDTSFAADLTVMEESDELTKRLSQGENLPLFTSCCPAWVKFAELNFPGYLKNLSTCRSPQQMLGSLVKDYYADKSDRELYMVSVMPCTAKKDEAKNVKFSKDGKFDVDAVITVRELVKMIKTVGLIYDEIEELPFDMPFGFTTGAGLIFGVTGGVTEAVLRALNPGKAVFTQVRGLEGIKEYTASFEGRSVKAAVVSGIQNAKDLLAKIDSGAVSYDIIEVMACPGGCVNGAGQPFAPHTTKTKLRGDGLYKNDKQMQLGSAKENPVIEKLYNDFLEKPGSHKSHELLHTHYTSRRRLSEMDLDFEVSAKGKKEEIKVCVGTCCYLNGAYDIFKQFQDAITENELNASLNATFCFENCKESPCVKVGDTLYGKVTKEDVEKFLKDL